MKKREGEKSSRKINELPTTPFRQMKTLSIPDDQITLIRDGSRALKGNNEKWQQGDFTTRDKAIIHAMVIYWLTCNEYGERQKDFRKAVEWAKSKADIGSAEKN